MCTALGEETIRQTDRQTGLCSQPSSRSCSCLLSLTSTSLHAGMASFCQQMNYVPLSEENSNMGENYRKAEDFKLNVNYFPLIPLLMLLPAAAVPSHRPPQQRCPSQQDAAQHFSPGLLFLSKVLLCHPCHPLRGLKIALSPSFRL